MCSFTPRKTLGANPENTFVIEDSVHGIAGAKLAGMRVIGFTGAAHSYPGHADVLTEAGAETVIRRWADFPRRDRGAVRMVRRLDRPYSSSASWSCFFFGGPASKPANT